MDNITVITFNLRKDSITDRKNRWNYRKEYAADVIRKTGADIIGVQEMLSSMKEDIKELLMGYTIVGDGRSKRAVNEHSDVILKNDDIELESTKTFWLSKKPETVGSRAYYSMSPRICTVAEIKFKSTGQKIRIFNTHFDHICGSARLLGVDIILKYMIGYQEKEPLPTILMGDLNASPNSRVIKKIRENKFIHLRDTFYEYNRYHNIISKNNNTFHFFTGKQAGYQIDYIFVTDEFNINKVYIERADYDGKYPSDHFPVVAQLVLNNKNSK